MEHKEYYRIKEFAKIMDIHPNTVKNYIKLGKIEAEQLLKGGVIRIHCSEIPANKRGF